MQGKKAKPQLEFCRALTEKVLTKNLDNNGRTVVQVGRPASQGSLQMVKLEHTQEKRPGFTGAWDENNDDWALIKSEYKKNTAPLLDAETAAGLFVHVKRKSPCVRGVTATIVHSCAA